MGLPEPEIIEIGLRVRMTIYLLVPMSVTSGKQASGNDKFRDISETDIEGVTEQVRRILKVLSLSPLSTQDAMEELGLKHRPTFVADYLQSGLNTGLLEMIQPDSPKSPTQKYRLIANPQISQAD